jgi:hypothetical protein
MALLPVDCTILPKACQLIMISRLKRLLYYRQLLAGVRSLVHQSPTQKEFLLWYARHGAWIPKFRNKYRGEDCFLLANGPSLNAVDFERINNYHLIGLNKIYLLFERAKLDLTFHVAINSLVIEQSWQQFAGLRCPSFLSHRPASTLVEDEGNVHYVLTEQSWMPRFSTVVDSPLWEGSTVTYAALQLAFFMGFRRVFIVGMDHRFNVQGPANSEQKLIGADSNHFDGRYFSDSQWHLPDLEGSEMAYLIARFAFQKQRRAIYDATYGGACTVFDKLSLEQAFEIARPRS